MRDDHDNENVKPIRLIFEQKKRKVGIRQLQMLLSKKLNLTVNRKKIARLKKKFGLLTLIRMRATYRYLKATGREHWVCPNILQRRFHPQKCDQIYSADITELKYDGGHKKAYLAAFKDLATKEIVSYEFTKIASTDLVVRAFEKAIINIPGNDRGNLIVHTDQGFQFTSTAYRSRVAESGATQSMSRRGNCHDNAPIESFFGYLKDHIELESVSSFEDMKKHVTAEIVYYNRERPQIGLNKMSPASYRRRLELFEREN